MKLSRQLMLKAIALAGLITVFSLANKEGQTTPGAMDLRAALLVFVAPLFVLLLFQKESFQFRFVFRRIGEILKKPSPDLARELDENTVLARGQYGFSHVLKLSENHPDSVFRYAGELYSARFSSQEISHLLVQKIQSEDGQWQLVCAALGFLAKMAPYFGMLATVMGMIKLLENMTDFSRISGSMALAMQGTLYGLISFTLVYSPMQRYFIDLKNQILKRNEIIARWFVLVAQQADPAFIRQEIAANFEVNTAATPRVVAQAAASPRSFS